MDVQDLNKKQLILLTLLITFIVSIATGIITVSLMKQMPSSVPKTINNVIQRTIEKVTTVEVPTKETNNTTNIDNNSTKPEDNNLLLGGQDALVSIYENTSSVDVTNNTDTTQENSSSSLVAIGQGIIISDVGLILVESNILKDQNSYKVILNKTDFNVSVLKKFDNGFTVLKISPTIDKTTTNTDIITTE